MRVIILLFLTAPGLFLLAFSIGYDTFGTIFGLILTVTGVVWEHDLFQKYSL